MDIQTVLFDLDGTLTRSGEGIINCAQYAAEQMHCRGPEDWSVFIGPPLIDSFRRFCGLGDAAAAEAVTWYRKRFRQVGWEENAVYPGIPRLLRSLRAAGIHAVIVTSKPEEFAVRIADRFGLSPLIDGIIGPGMGEQQPDKEHLIRRAMGQFPGPCVMVGDRVFDVEGAARAGIPSIFAAYGYGRMEEAEGAMAAAESPQALLDLLLPEGPRVRGLFLSMEGVDGCGKSTQQQALVAEMQRLGWEIVLTREPGGEEIAEKIRQLILDPGNTGMQDVTEAYLYAASRAQNARMRILPALERGEMVICDRYVDSSIAYQGGGRQLGMDRIRELNAWATENCMPDLTVYLRMEPHEALARRLSTSVPDRLEREQDSFFQRTFEAYEKLYDGRDGWRVVRVNAANSIEAVTQEMLMRVRQRLADLAKSDRQNEQE